jgi:hypothetical protein
MSRYAGGKSVPAKEGRLVVGRTFGVGWHADPEGENVSHPTVASRKGRVRPATATGWAPSRGPSSCPQRRRPRLKGTPHPRRELLVLVLARLGRRVACVLTWPLVDPLCILAALLGAGRGIGRLV